MTTDSKILAIVGPTACGKTRRAVELARRLNGEIISGDSRQVYIGMDIGTGKDMEEYGDIPVHLVNVLPAGMKYNLHRYLTDFNKALSEIQNNGRLPILCGGTGMYIEAALNGLVLPEVEENVALRSELEGKSLEELTSILSQMKRLHNTTDVDTPKRAIRAIEIEQFYLDHPEAAQAAKVSVEKRQRGMVIGLDISRELRRERITTRLDARLQEGMVSEVKDLLDSGIQAADLIYYGLEYKFVTKYILGELSYEEMRSGLETAIHQFAKRQMTWFRGMERRGIPIHWVAYDLPEQELADFAMSLLNTD